MPAVALAGRPQDPQFANLTQKIVDIVMTSAARASIAERGVQNVRLPENPQALEHAFAPMFRGTGTRPRQLRRAFGRPARGFAGVDFGDSKSVVEQAVANAALDSVSISPTALTRRLLGSSPQDMSELIAAISGPAALCRAAVADRLLRRHRDRPRNCSSSQAVALCPARRLGSDRLGRQGHDPLRRTGLRLNAGLPPAPRQRQFGPLQEGA